MKFQDITGQEFPFYGVCGNLFKLGDTVWEAREDEGDGYRSYLDSIEVSSEEPSTFFCDAICSVKVVQQDPEEDYQGFMLIDVNTGHEWLRVGTDYSDSYYPYFVFQYIPPTPPHTGEKA